MECADAVRNSQTCQSKEECQKQCQNPVKCVVKGETQPRYFCAPPGAEATQYAHPPHQSAAGKATNVRK